MNDKLFHCLFLLAGLMIFAWTASAEDGRTINLSLKSTPDGQLFYTELEIGQVNSKQTFNMLVATQYYITWLPSVKFSQARGYVNRKECHQKTREFNDYLVSKSATGFGRYLYSIYNDSWLVGSHLVAEQPFALIEPFDEPFVYFSNESKLDGILGLSGFLRHPNEPDYLFRNLFNLKLIDHLIFSLYINKTVANNSGDDEQNSSRGALVLGGIDENYFTGQIEYISLKEDYNVIGNRSLMISSIHLDWGRTNFESDESLLFVARIVTSDGKLNLPMEQQRDMRLKLDSSAKLFAGERKLLNQIHIDILGATNIGARELGLGGLFAFNDCRLDNKPDFLFMVDGVELRVEPEDYVIEDNQQVDGRKICISAFKAYPGDTWVFGTKFLRKHYTVFDYENHRIGFGVPK